MKTADLIPFLLIELNESDKYGFELTKNIETKSNGKIVIKQPTLYTLLKKLEKSKFITSYWQDSEIGGKRHYYKITDNGKLQLSTLPSYDVLMQNLLASEENADDVDSLSNNQNSNPKTQTKNLDNSVESNNSLPTSPVEAILPTEEVFAGTSLDTSTVSEINQANSDILHSDDSKKEESFATNIVVAKFVEVKPAPTPEIPITSKPSHNDIIDLDITPPAIKTDVKYVDYINLKTSKAYKISKKFAKFTILRASLVSLYIIALLISFAMLSTRFGTGVFYYSSFIIGSVVAIFYPILTAIHIDSIKSLYKQKNYRFNLKISLIIKFSIISLILLITLIFNIAIKNNSFEKIFSIYNFTNFYIPVLLSTSLIIDSLLAYVLISKIKN